MPAGKEKAVPCYAAWKWHKAAGKARQKGYAARHMQQKLCMHGKGRQVSSRRIGREGEGEGGDWQVAWWGSGEERSCLRVSCCF